MAAQDKLAALLKAARFQTIEECLAQLSLWEAPGAALSKLDERRLAKGKEARAAHEAALLSANAEKQAKRERLEQLLKEEKYDPSTDWQSKVKSDRGHLAEMVQDLPSDDEERPECLEQLKNLDEILQLSSEISLREPPQQEPAAVQEASPPAQASVSGPPNPTGAQSEASPAPVTPAPRRETVSSTPVAGASAFDEAQMQRDYEEAFQQRLKEDRARVEALPPSAERTLMLMQQLLLSATGPDTLAAKKSGTMLTDQALAEWNVLHAEACQLVEVEELKLPHLSKLEPEQARTRPAALLLQDITQALSSVRCFDLSLVISLVSRADAAAELLRGKDVIALIGATGVGKSTTIHFLAGTKLRTTSVRGLSHIGPVPGTPIAANLASVVCSPLMKSETRVVHAITIPCSSATHPSGALTLCDTPGFGDTAGPEADLANCVSIYRALRDCNSVRFVVLLSSSQLGDRMDGPQTLAVTLSDLMPNFAVDVQSLFFLFTKFNERERNELPFKVSMRLDDLISQQVAHTDPLLILLQALQDKLTANRGVCFLRPLDDSRDAVLQQIISIPPIVNPQDALSSFISDKSKSRLKDQLVADERAIRAALSRDPPNIALANIRLEQLARLSEQLGLPGIRNSYREGVRELLQIARNISKDCDRHWRGLKQLSTLDNDVIQQGLALVQQLYELHSAREVHFTAAVLRDLDENLEPTLNCNLRALAVNYMMAFQQQQCLTINAVQLLDGNQRLNNALDLPATLTEVTQAMGKLQLLEASLASVSASGGITGPAASAAIMMREMGTVVNTELTACVNHLTAQAKALYDALTPALSLRDISTCIDLLDVLNKFAESPAARSVAIDSYKQGISSLQSRMQRESAEIMAMLDAAAGQQEIAYQVALVGVEPIHVRVLDGPDTLDFSPSRSSRGAASVENTPAKRLAVDKMPLMALESDNPAAPPPETHTAVIQSCLSVANVTELCASLTFMQAALDLKQRLNGHLDVEPLQQAVTTLTDRVAHYLTLHSTDFAARDLKDFEPRWIESVSTFVAGLEVLKANNIANASQVWEDLPFCVNKTVSTIKETATSLLQKLQQHARSSFGNTPELTLDLSFPTAVPPLWSVADFPENGFHKVLHQLLLFISIQQQLAPSPDTQINEGFAEIQEAVNDTISWLSQMLNSSAQSLSNFDLDGLWQLGAVMHSLNALGAACAVHLPIATKQLHAVALPSFQTILRESDLALRTIASPLLELDAQTLDFALAFLSMSAHLFGRQLPVLVTMLTDARKSLAASLRQLRDDISQSMSVVVPLFTAANDDDATAAQPSIDRLMRYLEFVRTVGALEQRTHATRLLRDEADTLRAEFCGEKSAVVMTLEKEITAAAASTDLAVLQRKYKTASRLKRLDHFLDSGSPHCVASLVATLQHSIERISQEISTKLLLSMQQLNLPVLYAAFDQIRQAGVPDQLARATASVREELLRTAASLQQQLSSVTLSAANMGEVQDMGAKLTALRSLEPVRLGLDETVCGSLKLGEIDGILRAKHSDLVALVERELNNMRFVEAEKVLAQSLHALQLLAEQKLFATLSVSHKRQFATALQGVTSHFRGTCALLGLASFDGVWDQLQLPADCILAFLAAAHGQPQAVFLHKPLQLCLPLALEADAMSRLQRLVQGRATVAVSSDEALSHLKDLAGIDPPLLNANAFNARRTPRDVCEQLARAQAALSAWGGTRGDYTAAADSLLVFFEEQLSHLMSLLRACEPATGEKHLSTLEALVQRMPAEIEAKIAPQLPMVKQELAQAKVDHEGKLKKLDLEKLFELLQQESQASRVQAAQETKNRIDQILKRRLDKLQAHLRPGHPRPGHLLDLLPEVVALYTTYETFAGILARLASGGEIESLKVSLRKFLKTLASKLTETLQQSADLTVGLDLSIAFFKLSQSHASLVSALGTGVVSQFGDFLTHVVLDFTTCDRAFFLKSETGKLAAQDLPRLCTLLKDIKALHELQPKVEEAIAEAGTSVTNHVKVAEDLRAVRPFPVLCRLLTSIVNSSYERLTMPFLDNPALDTPNAADRDGFFEQLSSDFAIIQQADRFGDLLDVTFDVAAAKTECTNLLADQVEELKRDLRETLKDSLAELTESTALASECKTLDKKYCILRACSVNATSIRTIAQKAKSAMDSTKTSLLQLIANLSKPFLRLCEEQRCDDAVEVLVKLKTMACNMIHFNQSINEKIDEVLKGLFKCRDGMTMIGKLGMRLEKHPSKLVAPMLISEHSAFQGYAIHLFNRKTVTIGTEHVFKEGGRAALRAEGEKLDLPFLQEQYELFHKQYWELVTSRLQARDFQLAEALKGIVTAANTVAKSAFDRDLTVRVLTAHVFAYWTIEHSEHYFSVQANSTPTAGKGAAAAATEKRSFLLQPHVAQVLAIFRMLGVDNRRSAPKDAASSAPRKSILSRFTDLFTSTKESILDSLDSQLVQILTGEGKSVTLAVTATVLALLGMDVDCVCYSTYLSARDRKAFASLFDGFKIASQVKYGTFDVLCEGLINQRGDLRQLATDMITDTQTVTLTEAAAGRPRVLLIDEVDVFFGEDFFGNCFRPGASLYDPTITALIKYVWSQRNDKAAVSLAAVQFTPEYAALMGRFPRHRELIKECVKKLLRDLASFPHHKYTEQNGQICYKKLDSLVHTIYYGYFTMFAYMKEHDEGHVQQAVMESRLYFNVNCGSFSYAELPCQYERMMGVSGTLEALSAAERAVLKETFGISKFTYVPSMYGESNLDFTPNSKRSVVIETEEGFYLAIRREIDERLRGTISGNPCERAVLVYFETSTQLEDFQGSECMSDLKHFVQVITEKTSNESKAGLVRQACTAGMITLLTREFGRGTDFVCLDTSLNDNGGVHVIQTFLSDQLTEETQIKGRTARQGAKGSYSMVLHRGKKSLGKFMTEDEIDEMCRGEQRYDLIHPKRVALFETQCSSNTARVTSAAQSHKESIAFLVDVWEGRQDRVLQFLLQRVKRE